MIYTGQFKSINNTLYQVDINVNDGNNGTSEIIFSDEPFKIELNSNDTIYEPLKLSNVTCTIISDSYNFNLYSATAQGTKMTLRDVDNNMIKWVGYLTPNIYTQGFEQHYESIELEAIDGLSTLDNFKFESIEINKKIRTFEELIIHLVKKCNCYSKIYVNENNCISGYENQKAIDKLLVSEQNFFSEDNEAVTYKEVLTQVLQFLNYTIVADGDELYILNYDYLKGGFVDYHTYNTTNNWLNYSTGYTTLNHQYNVTANSFKSNGASVELATVYNQVSIKTNTYKKDVLIPDFFDEDKLTNTFGESDWLHTDMFTANNKYYFNRYYTHKDYTYIQYDNDTNWTEITGIIDMTTTQNKIGACVVKMGVFDSKDGYPNNISYNNYVQLFRHLGNDLSGNHNLLKPVLKMNVGTIPTASYLFGGTEYAILIGGSALWSDVNRSYIDDGGGRSGDSYSTSNLYLTAKLKIGDKCWDGSHWSTTDSTFKIRFSGDGNHLIHKWFDVQNQVAYYDNFSGKGMLIQVGEIYQLMGDVDFWLYAPQSVTASYRTENVFVKDLSIKVIKSELTKNSDTDTEYKNVINTDFVNEYSEMNLKVCSQTDKGMSYSSVLQHNVNPVFGASEYVYNSAILNKALNTSQLQEYNIIQSYVNQYSTPSKKLNITLANIFKPYSLLTIDSIFPTEKFIVDGMSIDVKNDTNLLNIVSKK